MIVALATEETAMGALIPPSYRRVFVAGELQIYARSGD